MRFGIDPKLLGRMGWPIGIPQQLTAQKGDVAGAISNQSIGLLGISDITYSHGGKVCGRAQFTCKINLARGALAYATAGLWGGTAAGAIDHVNACFFKPFGNLDILFQAVTALNPVVD